MAAVREGDEALGVAAHPPWRQLCATAVTVRLASANQPFGMHDPVGKDGPNEESAMKTCPLAILAVACVVLSAPAGATECKDIKKFVVENAHDVKPTFGLAARERGRQAIEISCAPADSQWCADDFVAACDKAKGGLSTNPDGGVKHVVTHRTQFAGEERRQRLSLPRDAGLPVRVHQVVPGSEGVVEAANVQGRSTVSVRIFLGEALTPVSLSVVAAPNRSGSQPPHRILRPHAIKCSRPSRTDRLSRAHALDAEPDTNGGPRRPHGHLLTSLRHRSRPLANHRSALWLLGSTERHAGRRLSSEGIARSCSSGTPCRSSLPTPAP